MTGSSGRLARGASHQKRTASAHRGPTEVLSRSSCSITAGESGFAGAGGCCCAATRNAAAHIIATTTAQGMELVITPSLSASNRAKDGLDEHVCRPRPGSCAIARIVVRGGPRRLHLLERGPGPNERANAIADDDHHIAILDDLVLVREIPVARHDQRSALTLMFEHRPLQNLIERPDLAIHGAAVCDV